MPGASASGTVLFATAGRGGSLDSASHHGSALRSGVDGGASGGGGEGGEGEGGEEETAGVASKKKKSMATSCSPPVRSEEKRARSVWSLPSLRRPEGCSLEGTVCSFKGSGSTAQGPFDSDHAAQRMNPQVAAIVDKTPNTSMAVIL